MQRKLSLSLVMLLVGAGVLFGMILGGSLQEAPERGVTRAGLDTSFLQPASVRRTGDPAATLPDFSGVAESALEGVVSIRRISVEKAARGADSLFRFFFRDQDEDRPRSRRSEGFGSGFIVSADGYILTNHHVVEDAVKITVELHDGKRFAAQVVGSDPSVDVALLKIDPGDHPLSPLPLGDSDQTRVGEWVVAIGNPLGFDHTVTVGVVSAKTRDLGIGATLPGVASFIQTDAAINRGNSGGPLLNARGEVIGINTAISRLGPEDVLVEGIGFALPINTARDSAEVILTEGEVRRGYLGIEMNPEPLGEEGAEYLGLPDPGGVLVRRVMPGGPAEKAGLKDGDVIRRVDGEVVGDNSELLARIAGRRPGDRVRLEVYRDGRPMKLTVRLGDREDMPRNGRPTRRAPEPEPEEPSFGTGLGIRVDPLTDKFREHLRLDEDLQGVVITQVDPDSPAADRGLTEGAVVLSLNDQPIRDVADWNRLLSEVAPGSPVKLDVYWRGVRSSYFLRVPAD